MSNFASKGQKTQDCASFLSNRFRSVLKPYLGKNIGLWKFHCPLKYLNWTLINKAEISSSSQEHTPMLAEMHADTASCYDINK